jgi:Fe2+ or Zn2+ uptake regulation protein
MKEKRGVCMYSPSIVEVLVLSFLNPKHAKLSSAAFLDDIADSEGLASFSKSTVYRAVVKLVDIGFVSLGLRSGKFHTYYITEVGRKFLKENNFA